MEPIIIFQVITEYGRNTNIRFSFPVTHLPRPEEIVQVKDDRFSVVRVTHIVDENKIVISIRKI